MAKTDPSGLEPPYSQEQMSEMMHASPLLTSNSAYGGIALAAHGSGLPAGAYGPPFTPTRPLTEGELEILSSVFGEYLDTDGLVVGTTGLFHDG